MLSLPGRQTLILGTCSQSRVMPAHNFPLAAASEAGIRSHPSSACAVCTSGVAPATTRSLPHPCVIAPPEPGQIWCIEESIFTPVATFLGATMPGLMPSASVASFGDDRNTKLRPCVVARKRKIGFEVYLFGTFEGGDIKGIPEAIQFFLGQVDPHVRRHSRDPSGVPLPCLHASPRWKCHPQYLVALPHNTKAGFGPLGKDETTLNRLDRPWTRANWNRCYHDPESKQTFCDDCYTFQFVLSQVQELEELAMRKRNMWHNTPERQRARMSKQFNRCLNKKIKARARDNASMRSIGSVMSEISEQSNTDSLNYEDPTLTPRSTVFSQSGTPEYPPSTTGAGRAPIPRNQRPRSPTNSSSGESEPELQTPALPSANLPQPLVKDLSTLAIDVVAASSLTDSVDGQLSAGTAGVITPKHSTFRGVRAAGSPRTPTSSIRSARTSARPYATVVGQRSGARENRASQQDEWPALATSPVTPTRHRRQDSKASAFRGV
ncbi:hypothetical protein PENSPDRAFT_658502 [Peniophora sp. CONT]|nr:hypothetical protein PENSPDRAFT_658502 [Peniophora sp. CONT]